MGARLNGVSGPVEARQEKDSQERKPRGRGEGWAGAKEAEISRARAAPGKGAVAGAWSLGNQRLPSSGGWLGEVLEPARGVGVFLTGGGPTGARS